MRRYIFNCITILSSLYIVSFLLKEVRCIYIILLVSSFYFLGSFLEYLISYMLLIGDSDDRQANAF